MVKFYQFFADMIHRSHGKEKTPFSLSVSDGLPWMVTDVIRRLGRKNGRMEDDYEY